MNVKIYIRPIGEEFQVESVEDETRQEVWLLADYSKALIKTAQLLLDYKKRDIQPQIFNELRTHVQVN